MHFYTYVKHYGNEMLVREIDGRERIIKREKPEKTAFRPCFYHATQEETPYRNIYGKALKKIEFNTNKDATAYYNKYAEVENAPKIYGNKDYCYQYISEHWPTEEIQFDPSKIKIFSLDIETTVNEGFPNVETANEEVLLITVQDSNTKKIYTFGTSAWERGEETKEHDVTYFEFATEENMLKGFLNWWSENYPDVITGWNTKLFDIPYLITRVENLLDEKWKWEHDTKEWPAKWRKMFSPFKLLHKKDVFIQNRSYKTYDVWGIAQLDYLDLYKKFTYVTRETYKLDHIAEVELGKKKLESGFDTFREFYEKDWNRFVDYNIIDTVLVDMLEDKMKLIELCLTMAYDAKCNYEDVFSAVRTWDCIIYNHLLRKNIIVCPKKDNVNKSIAGAFVQEPVPGRYEWVVSFDATSLYPSIIMQYNMSPDTLIFNEMPMRVTVDGMLERQEIGTLKGAMAANGTQYRKDKLGLFPEVVDKFFQDRQKYKKLMIEAQNKYEKTKDKNLLKDISKFNNFQMARKIQLNSLYGAMANQYFRYYDTRIAEGITLSGQFIIRETAKSLDNYLNKLCETENEVYSFYSDTDSCYITLKQVVEKFLSGQKFDNIITALDRFSEDKIESTISKAMDEIVSYTNAFKKSLVFKREAIADGGVWVAKKRYAMNVFDNEGVRYEKPKLKVLGLEIVRSSTPAPVRENLKDAIKICLSGSEDELQNYIKELKEEFKNMDPEEISFPRSCNNLSKYTDELAIYKKGTPIHVRGSLLFNNELKKQKLTSKYETIQEGDKIKFLYLKEPNTVGENVISFSGKLPKEFNLHKYVDYDTMFNKSFLEPIATVVKILGWETERRNKLDELFA